MINGSQDIAHYLILADLANFGLYSHSGPVHTYILCKTLIGKYIHCIIWANH